MLSALTVPVIHIHYKYLGTYLPQMKLYGYHYYFGDFGHQLNEKFLLHLYFHEQYRFPKK